MTIPRSVSEIPSIPHRGLEAATNIPCHAVITPRQAATAGLTRDHLRGPGFQQVIRGVHARFDHPDPQCLETRARAFLATTHPTALIASVSALLLMGVHVPGRLTRDGKIHVLVPNRGAHPVRDTVAVHWSQGIASVPKTATRCGIPVCDPIEAWMQTATIALHEELVQLGDQLVRYGDPLTTMPDLHRRVARSARRRHIRALRRALEDVRPDTQSLLETWLRFRALDAGLPEPLINQPIHDAAGIFIARPDLYWPALRLAGEYDGDYHGDPDQRLRDNERRRRLEAHGVTVIVATKADLTDPSRLIAALQRARTRALRTPPSVKSHL
ncbi:MAG: hypothetical protein LBK72_08125 [Bifidobacteriaceae bacterium]|jgi:hypothetical protein|nr:hypothetical protein [Bifidobacteriaceae bacterium]